MRQHLHVSPDFEARDDVRTLARFLRERGVADPGTYACVYVFRLWCDWARQNTDWRPISSAVEPVDWKSENVSYLIEEFCCWPSDRRGELMELFLRSETLSLVRKGELLGLALREYAFYNQHLLPGYMSREQKGGHVKAANHQIRQITELAKQQAGLFARQEVLVFPEEAQATEQERRNATALVMKLDMAFGRQMRRTDEYPPELMRDALVLTRSHSTEDIDTVARWLLGQRGAGQLTGDPLLVMRDFGVFLRRAREGQ